MEEAKFFAIDRFPTTTLMIGLTDASVEGQWLTFDGKSPSFTYWNTNWNEPSGGRAGNYAFAYSKASEEHHWPHVPAGSWNDVGATFYDGTFYLCTYELVCNESSCKFDIHLVARSLYFIHLKYYSSYTGKALSVEKRPSNEFS